MVAGVRIEGLERVNPAYVRSFTKIRPGDTVDIDAISADAKRMSALEDLDTVAYRIEREAGHDTLVWLPKEISVGASVLRPSVGFFADGGGDLKFLLGVQHVHRWLNDRGGQWRNNVQLGYESIFSTSIYQPLDVAQRFFVEPGLLAGRTQEDLYDDGDRVAAYRFVDYGGRVDFGWNISRAAQLRVGYIATEREAKLVTGELELPEDSALDAGLAITARYDSRNAATFATSGISAAVEYKRMDDSLGSDRDWERIEAGFRTAVPIRKNLFWISLAGGQDLGDNLPADRAFSLGGPRTLPAFQLDELRVGKYWLAEASFLWRLKELSPIRNQAVYGGFGLQAAGLYDRVDFEEEDDDVYGVSAYLAGPTPIGTFRLGVATDSEEWAFWFSLGRPIGKGSILDDGLFR
jgi:NTE family protein